jgi:sarcosine oxidase subunit gamma
MSDPRLQTALQHRSEAKDLSVGLREIKDRGMIDLRGLAEQPGFVDAVKSVLQVDLPHEPRTSASWGDIKVLWLSTDQWLILCAGSKTAELHRRLREALADIHSLVVDVSDMRSVIRLEGKGVREVLLKGCSLDLLGAGYAPSTVRRVRFAEIAALLHVIDTDVIDLYVFRSYADYAWEFLETAARPGAAVALFGKQDTPAV